MVNTKTMKKRLRRGLTAVADGARSTAMSLWTKTEDPDAKLRGRCRCTDVRRTPGVSGSSIGPSAMSAEVARRELVGRK